MPSVKDKKLSAKTLKEVNNAAAEIREEQLKRRRPSEEVVLPQDLEIKAVKVEMGPSDNPNFEASSSSSCEASSQIGPEQESFNFGNNSSDVERIQLRFPGDTIVKRGLPKAFNLTEEVVNGWAQGGKFESLPIQNPFVRYAAKTGLQKAKKVETKVLESPLTEKVITKVFEAGFKAQMTIEEIRQKLNQKK